ncbi:EamA family transporter [Lichenibacterium dinghuense]|uniref:EamA family transporter n=1 Tax=Lichenibacterium dinghuense TaxID=2895977 RepID=UPI001F01D903|nr:EamA family transporter [Lichenibacterium sp. 6Y81]
MTATASTSGAASALRPACAVVGGIVSMCIGTSFAKALFPLVGAEGTTALRVGFSALLLFAAWRPWRRRLTARQCGALALYGLALGALNLLFYMALRTVPFGIAVAIEFVGPLTVATLSSRRAVDALWIVLAALGLGLILPLGSHAGALDPLGIAYAAGAALAWALYIVFGQRAGRLRGPDAVAVGTAVAALAVLPFGVARAGAAMLDPALLPPALGVALLSSALPFSLEMYALRRLPRHTFGVLLSVEPAVAALAGLVMLGEALSPGQWLGIGCVVLASVGTAVAAGRAGA